MRFREITETYGMDNRYLRDYFHEADQFDPYHYWFAVVQWAKRDADRMEAFADILDRDDLTADQLDEEEPDIFYQLPQHLQKEAAEWATDYMMRHDPAEVASAQHYNLRDKQLLPRNTWLVHFTNDPDAIANDGFVYGTDDMARLGLTTYYNKESKHRGGYNFAFLAEGRHADWAASQGKYGKHAVMFQNSGVHVYHYGDEEDQVIFWGPDVKPRDIVVLRHYEYKDWSVLGRNDRVLIESEFENCVQWVMAHFAQYHRILTGF